MSVHFSQYYQPSTNTNNTMSAEVSGEFVERNGELYYAIYNVDQMPDFFISVVSNSDHWLFVSSNGGVTAGRISPEVALFPYAAVDKVNESTPHTGCKTLIRVGEGPSSEDWEPFNRAHDHRYALSRHLYKNALGNKLCFEEVNHDLNLLFRYTWKSSDEFGFVRQCELINLSEQVVSVSLVDGLQNILPAGAPREIQTNFSNLVDAYKWSELDERSGIATFSLYAGISDKPEPCESLRANTVFCLGLDHPTISLSSRQFENFRAGMPFESEICTRGIRGAFLVNTQFKLDGSEAKSWTLVADVEQSQSQVIERRQIVLSDDIAEVIDNSVAQGSEELRNIMGAIDGFQLTAEEAVSVHHYANVLFNGMRGGVFDDQYQIDTADYRQSIRHFNKAVYQQIEQAIAALPATIHAVELAQWASQQENADLERLTYEYIPLTFGRRHGDPSRPWNHFAIKLKDDDGKRLLSYQGNWRDIFQNWEALSFSYPEFIENIIAKFLNASTIDGYNPYRITKEGIDWEIEDPSDPWSYIGYWGDHQIIYLLKLLELSNDFHPGKLSEFLRHSVFCYANVPYRIKPFDALLNDAKHTVEYDHSMADAIERSVERIGADGKLVLNADDSVYLVNLIEKLLVPLLSKLGNLVPKGGIWLSTQRPEWNDANNALVGQGLSVVTLCYLRRYVCFMQDLLANESAAFELSGAVSVWLNETGRILKHASALLAEQALDDQQAFSIFMELGQVASDYRATVYSQDSNSANRSHDPKEVRAFLGDALRVIDQSILENQREDGLFHAYNLLGIHTDSLSVDHLYPMLEGQVAALSSGAVTPEKAVDVLERMYTTALYRQDQNTFMLYPDRQLPGFFEKNRVSADRVSAVPELEMLLACETQTILLPDADGDYRFNADLFNSSALDSELDKLEARTGKAMSDLRAPVLALYEAVFNHKEFTGRSGSMFGFEGLGSIYWHMVSKLLLASQEMFFTALDSDCDPVTVKQLAALYYRVRQGIGFNKSPEEYGAFPCDPYSHTPKHAGAQQPGMTGQVKEEVLTRFGELGLRVFDGRAFFQPHLLRLREFLSSPGLFDFVDLNGEQQELSIDANSLAFTWCQVPIVYVLDDSKPAGVLVQLADGTQQHSDTLALSAALSAELFKRTGNVERIVVSLNREYLYQE